MKYPSILRGAKYHNPLTEYYNICNIKTIKSAI